MRESGAEPVSVTWQACEGELASQHDLLLLDLDGVVYVGRHAVPGAAASLSQAAPRGVRLAFVTNNASRPPADVAEHLRELGIAAEDDEVVNSAQEGAQLLASLVPAGSTVLAVGGPGVSAALRDVGLHPVERVTVDVSGVAGMAGVAGVLQGFGVDVGWRDLAEASYAVAAGAAWVATNPDLTVPTPRGTAPGNGQLTAVVQRTTGVAPRVTGKPGPGLFRVAQARLGGARPLVVGDRLDTDIAGAVAAGLPSLLVLTGVSGLSDLLAASPSERPTYLARDLAGLWAAHPGVTPDGERWRCGSAWARWVSDRLEAGVDAPVSDLPADHELDLWRAACAAVWTAADARAPGDRTDVDVSAAATVVAAATASAAR